MNWRSGEEVTQPSAKPLFTGSIPLFPSKLTININGVRGSVVERHTDNVKVGGSIPPGPTLYQFNSNLLLIISQGKISIYAGKISKS